MSSVSDRRPTATKKFLASMLSAVAIAGLLFGLVGLLSSETLAGLLLAGVVMVGGGLLVARLAWRLYLGRPSVFAAARETRDPDAARAFARDLARRQWLTTAKFLLALVPVYLAIALLFADAEAALAAASVSAFGAAGLGLLSWVTGRRSA